MKYALFIDSILNGYKLKPPTTTFNTDTHCHTHPKKYYCQPYSMWMKNKSIYIFTMYIINKW